MRSIALLTIIILGLGFGNLAFSEDDHDHSGHDHSKKEKAQSHDDHKKHKEDHKGHEHDEHDSHGHDEKKGHHEGDDHKHHEDKHGHSGHDHHGGSKFGEGKAIVEVKKEGKLFKLATGAIKTLKLQTIDLDSSKKGVFEIPASAVVDFQDEIGIYRRNGDWFEMVEVKVVQRGKYSAKIKSSKLVKNDKIVSQGVALLRVAHLEASGQGGQGHVH